MALIAAELNADMVCLSHWHPEDGVVETLAESGGTGEERFSLDDYPLTARVLRDQEAVQVLVGDPEADRREVELLLSLGLRSLLMVPVVSRGESLGIVEAYSRARAALDAHRDQPRPDHLQPVRLGDPGPVPARRPP